MKPQWLSVCFVSIALSHAIATQVLYEPFDYSNIGGPVDANTPANWTFGGSPPDDLSVVSGNLFYSGLASSIGNSVTNGGAGLGVRRLFGTTTTSGTLYFSALFQLTAFGTSWNGASTQVGAFTSSDNTSFRLQVLVKKDVALTGYLFGVQKGGTGSTSTFDTTSYLPGDTVLLVGSYDFGTTPNPATLWINPNAATFEAASPPGTGFITATTGTDSLAIDRFNMRQNTAATLPEAMWWDELRVGTTWADVTPAPVPEPTAVTLAGLGLLALFSWKRFRRR